MLRNIACLHEQRRVNSTAPRRCPYAYVSLWCIISFSIHPYNLSDDSPGTSIPYAPFFPLTVEIGLGNTDNRFPTGNNELLLRGAIGWNKDEHSLDKKGASKADVTNLLESAGFSKSNPYYIVPQGRVCVPLLSIHHVCILTGVSYALDHRPDQCERP